MPVPLEVEPILARVHNPETRKNLREAFQRWENANRTLTTALLLGAHRIPLMLKGSLGFIGLINPLGRLLLPLGLCLGGTSVLEGAIRALAKHYEDRGQLTDETRKHFEDLVKELARANQR
jgi:hypothetical protein